MLERALPPRERATLVGDVRILSRRTLREFWKRHPDAEQPLRLWCAMVEKARWDGPAVVRAQFGSADFVAGDRAVFDIKGNRYRLVVHVRYRLHLVFVRFIGTHSEYDRVDVGTV